MNKTKLLLFGSTLALVLAACSNVPEPPTPGPSGEAKTLPYTESFADDFGAFTTLSVSGSENWIIDYDCAVMKGYVDGENRANEDWLISPKITMTGTQIVMSFDGVLCYSNTPATDATVWVSENYSGDVQTAQWTQLEIEFPNSSSFDFKNYQYDMSAYTGKTITVAFKYISTTEKAGTLEIKNFVMEEGSVQAIGTGEGTEASPYDVEAAMYYQGSKDNGEFKYVKGYIVGVWENKDENGQDTYPNNFAKFEAPFYTTENILLAASASETSEENVLCVQIPAGDVRDALNLPSNADILGQEVLLAGTLESYNTMPGLKNTCYYAITGGASGGVKPEGGNFDVEEISIADLRAMWSGSNVKITEDKKIVGIITSDLVGGNSTSLKNAVITSLDNTAGLSIRFTANHEYNMGDKVEILVKDLTLSDYDNLVQLNNIPLLKTQKVGTGNITPKETTIADVISNYSQYESTVVTVQGTITSDNGKWGNSSSHQSNVLAKDGNEIVLFIASYSNFVDEAVPNGEVSVTGIVGINKDTKQLIVRNLNDVK